MVFTPLCIFYHKLIKTPKSYSEGLGTARAMTFRVIIPLCIFYDKLIKHQKAIVMG